MPLTPRQRAGRNTEGVAGEFLKGRGLQLITRNYACRAGEIDLIMADSTPVQAQVLVFVEVRYRETRQFGGAAASVTPRKQRRLVTAARRFIQTHPQYAHWPARFDVVAMHGPLRSPEIDWLRGAFHC